MQKSQGMWVRSLGWEDPLEEDMATHSSILAWRIPWTEEPGGLQSISITKSQTQLKWLSKHVLCNFIHVILGHFDLSMSFLAAQVPCHIGFLLFLGWAIILPLYALCICCPFYMLQPLLSLSPWSGLPQLKCPLPCEPPLQTTPSPPYSQWILFFFFFKFFFFWCGPFLKHWICDHICFGFLAPRHVGS